MIDPELVGELEALCREPGMTVLAATTTEDLLGRVAVRFSLDRSRRWWWEAMPDARFVPYGAEEELTVLGSLLSDRDQVLTLVVTDDEAPPWIAVEGRWTSLLHLLRETRHFEFFVVDETLDWVVFDTHHSQVVVGGILPEDPLADIGGT